MYGLLPPQWARRNPIVTSVGRYACVSVQHSTQMSAAHGAFRFNFCASQAGQGDERAVAADRPACARSGAHLAEALPAQDVPSNARAACALRQAGVHGAQPLCDLRIAQIHPLMQLSMQVALFASGELQLKSERAPCLPAVLTWRSRDAATLVLTEGRYHQARRMFAATGQRVIALQRSAFGRLHLGDLAPGAHIHLPLNTFAGEL